MEIKHYYCLILIKCSNLTYKHWTCSSLRPTRVYFILLLTCLRTWNFWLLSADNCTAHSLINLFFFSPRLVSGSFLTSTMLRESRNIFSWVKSGTRAMWSGVPEPAGPRERDHGRYKISCFIPIQTQKDDVIDIKSLESLTWLSARWPSSCESDASYFLRRTAFSQVRQEVTLTQRMCSEDRGATKGPVEVSGKVRRGQRAAALRWECDVAAALLFVIPLHDQQGSQWRLCRPLNLLRWTSITTPSLRLAVRLITSVLRPPFVAHNSSSQSTNWEWDTEFRVLVLNKTSLLSLGADALYALL